MAAIFLAGARPATAQNDPYVPGAGVEVQVQVRPGVFISVTSAVAGEIIRIQGCLFHGGALIGITLNPGTNQQQGQPCPGSGNGNNGNGGGNGALATKMQLIGVARVAPQDVLLQTTTTVAPCPFDHPTNAGPADPSNNGGIATSNADAGGCLDTYVTVPNRAPGSYELCTVSTGVQTVCAVIQIASSTKVLGGTTSKGFARTGIYLIPLILGGVAAILVGRRLSKTRRNGEPAR